MKPMAFLPRFAAAALAVTALAGAAAPARADRLVLAVGDHRGHGHDRDWRHDRRGHGHDRWRHVERHRAPPRAVFHGFRLVFAPPPRVAYAPPPRVVYVPPPAPVAAAPASPVYRAADGRYCREYQATVTVNGVPQPSYGTACLEPDGAWHIVN